MVGEPSGAVGVVVVVVPAVPALGHLADGVVREAEVRQKPQPRPPQPTHRPHGSPSLPGAGVPHTAHINPTPEPAGAPGDGTCRPGTQSRCSPRTETRGDT